MSAFSNGDEYETWTAAWCQTCVHDIEFWKPNGDTSKACQVPIPALIGEPVPEWGEGPRWSPQTVIYCTKYQPIDTTCGDGTLPYSRPEANRPTRNCATCDGGGCPDCTDSDR